MSSTWGITWTSTQRQPNLGEGDGPRLGISRDSLPKHTTILGGTGSGKTVLAKVMLEELALSGVPSIVIDLQGDLAKLAEKPIEDQRADQDTLDAWRKGTEARVWTPVSESGLPISPTHSRSRRR